LRDHVAFGAALRRERERRGLTLATIAEQTKVSATLLEGLERGDLSRWPAGIFRRGFVKSYAEVVGLDAADVLAEFARVYPDDGTAGQVAEEASPRAEIAERLAASDQPLRLSLAGTPADVLTARRLAGIGLDLLVPAAGAVAITLQVLPDSAWGAVLAATAAYHAVGVIFHGTTIGTHVATRAWGHRAPSPEIAGDRTEAEPSEEPARRTPVSPLRAARRERRQAPRPSRTDGRSARH
jgi:transcriptional regulator with XRE-family HTH domain